MATYNFELNNRPNKRGNFSVMLRITENKKHKRIKTSVELKSAKYWNPASQEVRKTEPNFKVYNETLKRMLESAKRAEQTLEDNQKGITSQSVVNTMRAEKGMFSFISFAEDFSNRTKEAGDYRTYTKYITFLNKLKLFVNGVKVSDIPSIPKGTEFTSYIGELKKDLSMQEITLTFLNKFKAYLQISPNAKNPEQTLHPNTISKQFDVFKSLYNKAILELKEEGLTLKNNPFNDFVCETIDTNKDKLTEAEINLLNSVNLEKGSMLWHTRNCFMLAFYCAGMRAGDLIQLRGINIIYEASAWRISYRMDKTSARKEILLIPEALDILKNYINLKKRTTDYIFPLLDNNAPYADAITWEDKERLPYNHKIALLKQVNSKNSILNKHLNKLAEMAGITKKISMHIARHSFANIARQKKANVYDISKALGHSSLKITETYLSKFDTTSQDATIKQVFTPTEDTKDTLLKQLQNLSPEELSALLKQIEK